MSDFEQTVGNSTGTTDDDQRGKAPWPLNISAELRQSFRDYINILPEVTSHYSRAKSPHRLYLPTGMNINMLCDMCKQWLRDNNVTVEPVSARYYRSAFNSEFNVGFELN